MDDFTGHNMAHQAAMDAHHQINASGSSDRRRLVLGVVTAVAVGGAIAAWFKKKELPETIPTQQQNDSVLGGDRTKWQDTIQRESLQVRGR